MSAEPTQAYHFDGAAEDGEEEEEKDEEKGEPMDCDATVAYHIEGKNNYNVVTCTNWC